MDEKKGWVDVLLAGWVARKVGMELAGREGMAGRECCRSSEAKEWT